MTCASSDMIAAPAVDPSGFPEVITLDEAAALLGWSRQEALEAARDGELPVAKFGSSRPSQWRLLRDRVCGARGVRSG